MTVQILAHLGFGYYTVFLTDNMKNAQWFHIITLDKINIYLKCRAYMFSVIHICMIAACQ